MSGEEYRFEPELARAATLPAYWYRDPAIFEAERQHVFGRSWQLVASEAALAEPGDYVTARVGAEPLMVVRGEDGALKALSAVCRHRAGPVARGAGRRRSFQCGYHGWSYGLDGRLLATPEFEGVEGFERDEHALPRFRVESFRGFVFVELSGQAPPLPETLGAIAEEAAHVPLEKMRLHRRRDYELACNWKTYVDNYLEGYHIPIVHPALCRELDYPAYRVETRAQHSRAHAPLRQQASLYRPELAYGGGEALYYWVFPNLMLNLYPDNLQLNLVVPLAPERTLTRFEWYVLDPGRPGFAEAFEASFTFADQVQREDVAICEEVQRNLASRTYTQGRYSVSRENGVHHFHGLVARRLQSGS